MAVLQSIQTIAALQDRCKLLKLPKYLKFNQNLYFPQRLIIRLICDDLG